MQARLQMLSLCSRFSDSHHAIQQQRWTENLDHTGGDPPLLGRIRDEAI